MEEKSAIKVADFIFNPWSGVEPVVLDEAVWNDPIKWNREAEKSGVRCRVFCEWSDCFCPGCGAEGIMVDVNDVRRRLFNLIDATPNLDWLLSTKQPENIRKMWPIEPTGVSKPVFPGAPGPLGEPMPTHARLRRPNVWLGATVEDQEQADKRIPELLKCRDLASKLFLSCEPLLGPVGLQKAHLTNFKAQRVDWVIAGGESGPDARPSHPDWFRSIRDQCEAAGVPFYFKQWGEWAPATNFDPETFHDHRIDYQGRDVTGSHGMWSEEDAFLDLVGKKKAVRLLDGVEHKGVPSSHCMQK